MDIFEATFAGFFLGLSLIIAIGAQNAFILRQGLIKQHVFILTTICFLSDAVLIGVGVAGLGTILKQSASILQLVTLGGACFLFVYGLMALIRVFKSDSLEVESKDSETLKTAILFCLAITWGNPHVYLDTVVLLGSLSARYSGIGQVFYAIGGMIASGVWFYSLGYGARLLAPIFSKPIAWKILDLGICAIMWSIALSLIWSLSIFGY